MAGGVHDRGDAWHASLQSLADTTRYGQGAGGMHPTAMHSCLKYDYVTV